ncbi:hypothetical protein M0805_008446 [Coniferiporia weirii]|nr:hypothetical protein M0805_008446 [Coniferiporia weirii]
MLSPRSNVEPIDSSLVTAFMSQVDIQLNIQVKYFWANPRNFVSSIYFLNRYLEVFSSIAVIPHFATILLIDYILLIRVVALFHGDKKIDTFLKVLYGLNAGSGLGLLIYGEVYQEIVVGGLVYGLTTCASDRVASRLVLIISWTIPLIYGVILMALALYKAAEHWRVSGNFSGFNLVKILVQDQAIYFLMVIFSCVGKIIGGVIPLDSSMSVILGALSGPFILCVLGSRLLVHLKEAGEKGLNGGTSYRARTMSDIEFS